MANQEYEYHEFANLFPLIEGEDFAKLVEDIRANGQREDIILHEDKIIDGRNRYRACREAAVEPRFRIYDGDRTPWGLLSFVVSLNVRRRHLPKEELAICAAEADDLLEKLTREGRQAMQAGAKKGGQTAGRGRPKNSPAEKVAQGNEEAERAPTTRAKLAAMFDVNERYVGEALSLKRNDRETYEAVKARKKRLSQVKAEKKKQAEEEKRLQESADLPKSPPPAAVLAITNSPLIVLSPEWYKPGGPAVHNDEVDEKGGWELASRLDPSGAFVVFRTMNLEGAIDRAFHLRDRWKLSPLGWCIPVGGMSRFGDYATEILVVATIGRPELPTKLPKRDDEVRCPAAGIMSLIHSWFAEFVEAKGTANLAIEIGGDKRHKGFQLLSIENLEAATA